MKHGRLPGWVFRGLFRAPSFLLLLVFFLSSTASLGNDDTGEAPSTKTTLRVVTLNLAHGRGLAASPIGIPPATFRANLNAIARFLQREQADVVALQEADAPSAWSGSFDHVRFLTAAAEYPNVFHGVHLDIAVMGVQVRYGTALLSRLAMDAPRSYPFRVHSWNRKGFVTAQVRWRGRTVRIVSVHFDSQSVGIRQRQAQELIETLSAASQPTIVMGDFNSGWDRPTDAVRLVAKGLNLHPWNPHARDAFTFPSIHPRKRIDWVLLSSTLAFVRCRTLSDRLSDHLAVVCDIHWPQGR